jgi:CheY-like chemotaxis protein
MLALCVHSAGNVDNPSQPAWPIQRKPRILVAETDKAFRATIAAMLRVEGYEVIDLASGFELLQTLQASMEERQVEKVDLVICDAHLSGKTGLNVFSMLGNAAGIPPVVFTTSGRDMTVFDEANRLGAIAVMEKPVDIDELLGAVQRIVDDRKA